MHCYCNFGQTKFQIVRIARTQEFPHTTMQLPTKLKNEIFRKIKLFWQKQLLLGHCSPNSHLIMFVVILCECDVIECVIECAQRQPIKIQMFWAISAQRCHFWFTPTIVWNVDSATKRSLWIWFYLFNSNLVQWKCVCVCVRWALKRDMKRRNMRSEMKNYFEATDWLVENQKVNIFTGINGLGAIGK